MSLDTHVEEGSGPSDEVFDVDPPYVPDEAVLEAIEKHEDRFLDRELSWLRLNQRVLELAEDRQLPLLERVRFAAIFTSNLDEFFMVRVAGLKRRIAAGVAVRAASGRLPREILELIWTRSRELSERHAQLFRDDLVPSLSDNGIELVRWADLDREEQKYCKKLFKDRVFPVLTPLAVDPAHPFPYISGLSLNLAVALRNPKSDKQHFARVKVPPIFARFVPLGNQRFVPLEDVIGEHLKRLFPGMEIQEVHTFRVTRNEDLEVEEDDAENLLAALEKELLRRKFGPPVRLEVEESMTDSVLELLADELGVSVEEVVHLPGPLDLRGLHGIADQNREDLKYPAFVPTTHSAAGRGGVGRAGRRLQGDAAPRRAAAPPLRLVRHVGAAVHRAGRGRPARAGDQADALPHLRRLADHRRPHRRRRGRQAGAGAGRDQGALRRGGEHPLGPQARAGGLSRRLRPGRPQDPLQAGDGRARRAGRHPPLHPHRHGQLQRRRPSRSYEDLGLITTDEKIGEDVAHLFNNLSGWSRNAAYEQLLVAPDHVRSGLLERIHREIEHQRAGRPARIRMKMNSLVDEQVIDALYLASTEGVPVQLITRAICALRPGVPGLSESIEVRSILGRFLEHSRVYWFDNGGEPEAWIGSADMMHRNLDRRVEVLVRLPEAELVAVGRRHARPGVPAGDRRLGARSDGDWVKQRRHGPVPGDADRAAAEAARQRLIAPDPRLATARGCGLPEPSP